MLSAHFQKAPFLGEYIVILIYCSLSKDGSVQITKVVANFENFFDFIAF